MSRINLSNLEKIKKLAAVSELVTESIVSSDKVGFKFKVTMFDGKEVAREYIKDESYVIPVGSYEKPIPYIRGMEVDEGCYYFVANNEDIPVMCIKNGTCNSFYDSEYFDVIPGYTFEGYSEEDQIEE